MAKSATPAATPPALVLGAREGMILLDVYVVPRAARTAILGRHGERVKVALHAPPVDGAANEALVSFFAQALSLRPRDVTLVRGDKSRQKTLGIRGSSEAAIRSLCG